MNNAKNITRREALTKMGAVAAGVGLGTGGIYAADVLRLSDKEEKRKKMKVFDKSSAEPNDVRVCRDEKSSMKMKVLAINGSSRKDGNTADMLNLVLGELEKEGYETEHIQLAGNTINPCKACFGCAGKKNCVFSDDIFQELYRKMTQADAILLGSPTYSADVSSTLKAVIERASVVSDANPGMFRHKVGGAVAVARRAGAMNTIDTINHFFLNKEMYVAGSTYWNIAYGRLLGEAMKDQEGVANMKNLGQNIAWLLSRLKD